MTVRTTMADLIDLVRDQVGDTAGTTQQLSDSQIERALDVHRWEVRNQELLPLETIAVGGATSYLTWYSEEMYWENDVTFMNGSYAALTPSVSFTLHGRWTFGATQTAVLITGQYYDPYGAAADLLEVLAAKYAPEYDVTADGASLARSQRPKALQQLANQYRKQQRVAVGRMVRDDLG